MGCVGLSVYAFMPSGAGTQDKVQSIALGQATEVSKNVEEIYIPCDGTYQDESVNYISELNIDLEQEARTEDKSDWISLGQAKSIPENVTEIYLSPVEIEEGVFEYRDEDGTLVVIMYTDPSKMPQALSTNATTYSVDLDVDAGSWAHTDEGIDLVGVCTVTFDIDFARETRSFLGQYHSIGDKVFWLSDPSTNGFYRSYSMGAGNPFCVAIKNLGNKANIYTGSVTVK